MITRIGKAFPGLRYWARLPGVAAFCGAAAGIGAARAVLINLPDFAQSAQYFGATVTTIAAVAAVIAATLGILCRNRLVRATTFAVCGAMLFAGAELGLRDFYRNMETVSEHTQIFTLTVRITSPVSTVYSSNRFRGRVTGAEDAKAGTVLTGRTLQFTSRGTVPPYGVITVQGRYSAPRPAAGPLGFDQREHYAVNNIHGNFEVSRIIGTVDNVYDVGAINDSYDTDNQSAPRNRRQHIITKLSPDNVSYKLRTAVHSVINKASNAEARAIFHAAFLGEKEHLTPELRTSFRRSGIVHLLAISGFHAALLYGAVFAVLGLFIANNRPRTFISLAFLWCYLLFIGFIPSLFRATVMVTFFCLSTTMQRRNHAVHSLGVAGFFWLCLSPHSLFAPGFQLSFAATAGIVMLQPVLNGLTIMVNEKIHSKPLEFLVKKTLSPFWVSLAGFAATAPPLLHHFGTLSLFGIIFNLAAIPLMSAAMWLFFIAVVLSPIGFIVNILVWCAEKVLGIMIYLSALGGGLSWSEIVVPVTTAPQIAVMVMFMAGLCAVRKSWRGRYALHAGAATFALLVAISIHTAIAAKTENLEFTLNKSTINVVTYKDNTAWIIAQGRQNDIRRLRTNEVEPLLYRKRIRDVPLILINEDAEDEAHMFTFSTDFEPRIISVNANHGTRRGGDQYGSYTIISTNTILSANRECKLLIDSDGRLKIDVSND